MESFIKLILRIITNYWFIFFGQLFVICFWFKINNKLDISWWVLTIPLYTPFLLFLILLIIFDVRKRMLNKKDKINEK